MELSKMTHEEIKNLDRETIFFITIGSIEAHGPHLPVATDFLIAKKLEEEMLKKFDGVSLPPIFFTSCYFLDGFEGTISVSHRAVYKMLVAIIKEMARWGFKYLVICNFHMDLFHLRAIYKAIWKGRKYGVIACEPVSVAYFNKNIFDADTGEIHADERETSLALYLFPEMVKNHEKVKSFKLEIKGIDALKKFRKLGVKNTYIGSPSAATAEKGKIYFEKLLEECEKGIRKMKEGKMEMPEKLKFFLRI